MKKLFFLTVLLAAVFSLNAQKNADAVMKELTNKINAAANCDVPEAERKAMISKVIQEHNAKNPAMALKPMKRKSLQKDKTKLTKDQIAKIVDLYKEANTIAHPEAEKNQPISRGATPIDCFVDYCLKIPHDKPYSCYDINNPFEYCIVMYPALSEPCSSSDQFAYIGCDVLEEQSGK